MGDDLQAVMIFRKAIDRFPSIRPLYLHVVELCLKAKRIKEAIEVCDRGMHVFPEDEYFFLQAGHLYDQTQDTVMALRAYYKAVHLDEAEVKVYKRTIELASSLKEYEMVVNVAELACKVFADEETFYIEKGKAHVLLNELHEAIESFRLSLRISPGNKEAYANLYRIYCEMKDLKNAVRICPENKMAFNDLFPVMYS